MSLKRYMCIDLFILGAILCGLEFLNSLALQYFPGEVFTLSVVLPITLIVMMRWGAYGVLHAVVGGLVYCIFNQGGPSTYLIYTLGNACIALNLVWFKKIGKEADHLSVNPFNNLIHDSSKDKIPYKHLGIHLLSVK